MAKTLRIDVDRLAIRHRRDEDLIGFDADKHDNPRYEAAISLDGHVAYCYLGEPGKLEAEDWEV